MSLLDIRGLHAGYGQMTILKGVDMALEAGEIGVIVGPNGAGKSTTLKAIFGMLNITEGSIRFDGADITGMSPEKLAAHKVAMVPQENNVFKTLSVHENLEMGAYTRRDDYASVLDQVYEIFPPLKDKRRQPAGELSGGQRQMVAFGPDDRAEAHPARRADGGPLPDVHVGDFRPRHRHQQDGRHGCDGGAERQAGTRHRA
jgi:branched-chain amino acid transport system ATP-binding protein